MEFSTQLQVFYQNKFQCHLNYISNPAISPYDNLLSSKLKEDQYDVLGKF
jgi:hypothetical protein